MVVTFDPEGFREWVKAHDPNQVIGLAQVPDRNPLSNWLVEEFPFLEAEVYRLYARVFPMVGAGPEREIPLPGWMTDFIEYVRDHFDYCAPITAAQALEILDRVVAYAH